MYLLSEVVDTFTISMKIIFFYLVLYGEELSNNAEIVSGGQQRDSAKHICIHSPPNSPPTQASTWHWAEFPVLKRILETYTKKKTNKSPKKTWTHLTILKSTTVLNKRYHETKENTALHTRWYLKTGLKWQNKYLTSVIQQYGKG